jgi:hypothetical protein
MYQMDQMESNEVLSDDFNMIYHNIFTIRNKNKRGKATKPIGEYSCKSGLCNNVNSSSCGKTMIKLFIQLD